VPSGDALRVWFPEMLEVLTAEWSPSTTWDELADVCSRLTELRNSLRHSRGIQAPLMSCPKCGSVSRAVLRDVSVNSALFALRKAGALPDADFRRLEHEWKKHRAAQGLDAFGKKRSAPATSASSHSAGCC
jgi:hypothetical protein